MAFPESADRAATTCETSRPLQRMMWLQTSCMGSTSCWCQKLLLKLLRVRHHPHMRLPTNFGQYLFSCRGSSWCIRSSQRAVHHVCGLASMHGACTISYHTSYLMLYHIVSYHTIQCYVIPYHTIPYHTIPYHTIPYHTIPYHTIPYHTIPYHTIPYHTIPYHTISYHSFHIVSYQIISFPNIAKDIITQHIMTHLMVHSHIRPHQLFHIRLHVIVYFGILV